MQTHAITIRGHRTSLSLEPEFWAALKTLAGQAGKSIAALVAEIDAVRPRQGEGEKPVGLSSAIRVYVLRAAQDGAMTAPRPGKR